MLNILKKYRNWNYDPFVDDIDMQNWTELEKTSKIEYQKYVNTDIPKRRAGIRKTLNRLIDKGYVEKIYSDGVRYRLKDEYLNFAG